MSLIKQDIYKSATLNFESGLVSFDESGVADVRDEQLKNLQNFFGNKMVIADEDGNFLEPVAEAAVETPAQESGKKKVAPRTAESAANAYSYKSIPWLKEKIIGSNIAKADEVDVLEKADLIKLLVEEEFPTKLT